MRREQLHEYQNYCVEFVKTHPEALLILSMGLGKTVISLTAVKDLLEAGEVNKVLVIAPLRVARDVWPDEAAAWEHTKDLRVSVMVGSADTRAKALRTDADLYVINRENLRWLTEELRYYWPFDMVVIDELSGFKNPKAVRYKALKRVRPFVKRIVGLTGTPTSNGLMDLWAEVGIIDKGQRLGRFIGRYRQAYFTVGSMNPYTGVVYRYETLPGAEEKIYDKISDITISMDSLDYLDMPDCVYVKHKVKMDRREQKLYDELKKELVVEIGDDEIDASNAAVLSGKLLQMANGALYSEDRAALPIHSHKLDMLSDLIEQAAGQSVLVAYWYKHDRDRIMGRLKADGLKPVVLRSSQDFKDWNEGKIQIALINPASAGHGLNLQRGGHILIWFSLIWSLELYQQTNSRLWRQGQKDVVSIHHIVCDGTVDEDVLDALEHKDTSQRRLINAVKAQL